MEKVNRIYITMAIRLFIILLFTVALMLYMNYSFHKIVPGTEMAESVFEFWSFCRFIIGMIAGTAIIFVVLDASKQFEEGIYDVDVRFFRLYGTLCVSGAELLTAILLLGYPGIIPIVVMMAGLVVANYILLRAKLALDSLCKTILISKKDNIFEELFFEDDEDEVE